MITESPLEPTLRAALAERGQRRDRGVYIDIEGARGIDIEGARDGIEA